ncbi:DUF2530 domain-containing protein [Luteimicrobium subarcticum]|uniref:Uncharacterized protein DUF2530 n=1 Tax=Luteimicrobium subarcticum TaxID=620910 RepID=A0A2M8WST3_9MICO|nr:DUF2530 domain-containing protein [Luteimicrobium subarcticum]PJI94007.1 uncharacterized protein DUF2530 [Luteimicrobium subarcticum]
MPSLVDVVLHPERRRAEPPVERVDLRLPLYLGLAAWGVVLVVAVVLAATGSDAATLVWTAVAGIAVGGLGLLWERRNRARYLGKPLPSQEQPR